MKAIKMINILLATFLIGLLFSSGGTVAQDLDQTRPNVIYREVTQYYNNQIVKGNTSDSPLEILLNSATYAADVKTVRGDANVDRNNGNITISGPVNFAHVQQVYSVLSGYQNDSYLENVPVDERFSYVLANRTNFDTLATTINVTIETNADYSTLQSNENFTEVVRENLDLTGFIFKTGRLGSITINDTQGDPLVTVVGFVTYLRIYIFQTSTEEIVGAFEATNTGFGNIFPSNIISYLSNQTFINEIGDGVSGLARLQGQDRISWYYNGYNSTLDLDVYSAQFEMLRETRGILYNPNQSSSLQLNAVSAGLELFMTQLEESNDIQVDTASVSNFDDEIVDDAVEQEQVNIPSTEQPRTSSESELEDTSDVTLDFNNTALFAGQILALVVVGNVLFKRMRH